MLRFAASTILKKLHQPITLGLMTGYLGFVWTISYQRMLRKDQPMPPNPAVTKPAGVMPFQFERLCRGFVERDL